jgi:Flp pilus assembly protein CpaB
VIPPHETLASRLRQFVRWHRRATASALAACAVLLAMAGMRPAPAPTTELWVAGRDLRGGETLTAAHLERRSAPPGMVPAGALGPGDLVGRLLAAPVRRGEPLTDLRVMGRSLLDGYGDGTVASPVRLADPGVSRLLTVGDLVDVLAAAGPGLDAAPRPVAARTVARGARVALVAAAADPGAGAEASIVLLVTSPRDALGLAEAAATSRLSVVLRR